MNLFNTPEFKVGLLVVIVSGLIGLMSIRVSEDPDYLGRSKRLWFVVEDASGLIKKSPARVAGIRVGIIEDIYLQNGMARINLLVKSDVELSKSSKVEIRPNGILGDKHIEIIPGNPDDPKLEDKDQILHVEDHASIDRLVNEVSKITGSLSKIADNIKDATDGDDSKPLGKIVKNLEILTTDMAEIINGKRDELDQTIDNIHEITENLNQMFSDKSENGLVNNWNRTLHRVDNILNNIDGIASKINNGEGTIGRLINDETTVEEINTAVSGINNFLDAGNKLSFSIDYNSNYMDGFKSVKSYIGLNIKPGHDRFYELAAITTPEGSVESFTKDTTGTTTSSETTTITHSNRVRFTALFGKRFYDLGVKAGMIEDSGGFGLEYNMLSDDLKLHLDAYNFQDTQVRLWARYNIFKGLYVMTGRHEYLKNPSGRTSNFIGAGLFLNNDDLKLLFAR